MSETLAFRVAQVQVRQYSEEADGLMKDHEDAMDCLDCEAFLQMGIGAFNWLICADQTLRKAVYRGLVEYNQEVEDALSAMCVLWLQPCELAEKWVARQDAKGYKVDNLREFRRCCDEMRSIIRAREEETEGALPMPMAELQDQALAEFHNGQTSEFLEGV